MEKKNNIYCNKANKKVRNKVETLNEAKLQMKSLH